MPKFYSENLRWRAVWLYTVRGMPETEIAGVLFMCVRSVQKYLSLFHSTESVAPRKSYEGPANTITDIEETSLLQSLINTYSYLHEIQSRLHDTTGKWIHASTICHTIHKHNFTHKKVRVIAL